MRRARDLLKTRQAVLATKTRETLSAAAKLDDITEVQAALDENKECAQIELVRPAYERLAAHFGALREVARRQLSGALTLSEPASIVARAAPPKKAFGA